MAREGAGTLFTVTFTWCPDLHIAYHVFVFGGICNKWYLNLCLQLTVFVFHGHLHLLS